MECSAKGLQSRTLETREEPGLAEEEEMENSNGGGGGGGAPRHSPKE